MDRYRKAVVAGAAGLIGALGVAVTVTVDNSISLNDALAIAFAGASAIGGTIGVAITPNRAG